MQKEKLKLLKEKYPKGTLIQLDHMEDPYRPVPDETLGTVKYIDDSGTIHMSWENGQSLGIMEGEDLFSIVDRPNQLRVLIVEPNEHPRAGYINYTLEDMKSIVGGYIEAINLDDKTVLICNEEGKLKNLQLNRSVGNDIIAGTFFIAGDDGVEDFISLTNEQIKEYTEKFYEIEDMSMKNNDLEFVSFHKF